MPYENMVQKLEIALDERLDYYASDLESVGEALDDLRTEDHIDRDTDSKIRMVILALASITHSLEQEAENIRSKRR